MDTNRNNPMQYAFEPKVLDEFLQNLTEDAPQIGIGETGLVGLIEARKKACCSMAEAVDLLLAKELKTIRAHTEKRGFLTIMVSADEIRELVQLQDHGPTSGPAVDKIPGTSVPGKCLSEQTVKQIALTDPIRKCTVTFPIVTAGLPTMTGLDLWSYPARRQDVQDARARPAIAASTRTAASPPPITLARDHWIPT